MGSTDHTGPDKKQGNTHRGIMAGKAKHVLVQLMFSNHGLAFQGFSQPVNLVPVQGCLFKGQPVSSGLRAPPVFRASDTRPDYG